MRQFLNPQPLGNQGRNQVIVPIGGKVWFLRNYLKVCAMKSVRYRSVSMVWVWMCVSALVSAQITFSRDWTGGKRSAPHLALDCNQFAKLCRHFVHELKQAMSPEISGKRQRDDLDKPPTYDDE